MMVFHDFGIDIWISVVSKKKKKKDRQGRRRWWLQNDACTVARVRLSNQLARDLDLACETRKRRDDRYLKFLLSVFTLFLSPSSPSPHLIHGLYFQLISFSVTHSSTITCILFLRSKNRREIEIKSFKNQRNIDFN